MSQIWPALSRRHNCGGSATIVANAQVYPEREWSVDGGEPSLISMVEASFDAALGILNTETVSLAKQGFLMWEARANAVRAPNQLRVRVHFVLLTFEQIDERAVRDRMNAMPTTFRLCADEVNALVAGVGPAAITVCRGPWFPAKD